MENISTLEKSIFQSLRQHMSRDVSRHIIKTPNWEINCVFFLWRFAWLLRNTFNESVITARSLIFIPINMNEAACKIR